MEKPVGEKLSIVLVDDSRSALAQVEALLAELDGVDVVGKALTGADALRVVSECRPDLVLMDIVMPEMDGLAALRLLLARDPSLRVAMVSSVGSSESRANTAFRLGAVQVLAKPIDREQLDALIASERERRDSESGAPR